MAVQWALVIHGLVTAVVVVSLLCGQWPIFQGTLIQCIHYFITFAAYDYFLRFVSLICGSRGRNAILSVEHYCCDRPNPILQLFYLAILGVTYGVIANSSFQYIPNYYVSEVHRYISMLAVGMGIILFILTRNVSNYLSAYPYDKVIYVEKECPTCKIPKPARSKHCGICDRCVARFDHHCGWMNNCIGEKNNRYFMAFLLWHFLLCLYGSVVLGLILAGELEEKKVIHILTAIISSLLAGFFGYHAHLCLTNTTTNETFKWQEYISWQRKVNEAKTSTAALKASIMGMKGDQGEAKAPQSKWRLFFRKFPKQHEEVVVKDNKYDKGIFSNVCEILFPLSERRSFSQKKTS